MKKLFYALPLIMMLVLIPSKETNAQVDFGARAGVYTDVGDPFIGAELLFPISGNIYFNPNIEYVFVDVGNYMTFNADAHYDFPVQSVYLWAGAGLAIAYRSVGDFSDTSAGLNLLTGVGLKDAGSVIPYAQLKIILADNSEVALGLGIRF